MTLHARCTVLSLAVLACGGRHPPQPRALCTLVNPARPGAPDAETWMALLLQAREPANGRLNRPLLDCTGTRVQWEGPALRCEDGVAAAALLPGRPLGPADVFAMPAAGGTTLVWIATTHYATGDAAGPVALVASVGRQLRVLALGVLRAYRERVRLRLEDLGGVRILVAEGEYCPGGDHALCVRAGRLVPLRGDRFMPEPLLGEDGKCISPAWLESSRQEWRRSRAGWERLELAASISFSDGRLIVEEQVAVSDVPAGLPERASGRTLHRAQSAREIRWMGGHLVASATPLWWRMAPGEEP